MNTPTIMSPMASANNPVSRIFGASSTTSRARHRRLEVEAITVIDTPDGFGHRDRAPPGLLRRYAPRNDNPLLSLRAKRSNLVGPQTRHQQHLPRPDHLDLGRDDFFPDLGELRLVGRPDLLLGDLAK